MKILTIGGNYKINKSDAQGEFKTAIIHLAPADLSGHEVCRGRSPGCTKGCLHTAGLGKTNMVQQARINKTKFLFESPKKFHGQLLQELESFVKHCNKRNLIPACRPNGTSDLDWTVLLPRMFDLKIQFYDYTKITSRMRKYLNGKMPENYHLTFSRSENNQKNVEEVVKLGGNVAVVFREVPTKYLNKKVFNGDQTDLRFLDPKKSIIGLTNKGRAKKDTSGFVI